MSSPAQRIRTDPIAIEGPSGILEGIVDAPASETSIVAVLCHPHPQFGGTMTNKVVHLLARACNDLGATAVRFNYRGVGASVGTYDEGRGETDDALAVIDWAQQRWPGSALWLGGFSFGGAIAIKAAARRPPQRLVTVAPAVRMVPVDQLPECPWLLVQGESDELVDAKQIQQWVTTLQSPPQLALLPGVDHFFHGRLTELREVVVKWGREGNDSP
jgi:alpha/beta superfamily hydrolase